MDIYIGVNGIARRVKNIYIGVNGVAKKVVKGYIGVNGIARLFYSSLYTYSTNIQSEYSNRVTFNNYFVGINSNGDIEISATAVATGSSSSNVNGRAIYFRINGDLAGKSLSFDYTSSGYTGNYSTINHDEIDSDGNWTSIYDFGNGSGSKSRTISNTASSITFGMWFGGKTSSCTVKLIISNLKIDGKVITF